MEKGVGSSFSGILGDLLNAGTSLELMSRRLVTPREKVSFITLVFCLHDQLEVVRPDLSWGNIVVHCNSRTAFMQHSRAVQRQFLTSRSTIWGLFRLRLACPAGGATTPFPKEHTAFGRPTRAKMTTTDSRTPSERGGSSSPVRPHPTSASLQRCTAPTGAASGRPSAF